MKNVSRVVIVVASLFLGWQLLDYYTYEFSHDGDMAYELNPFVSPDGRYEANVYFDNYGGAAGGTNLIVKVKDNEDGKERTIYYGDGKSTWYVKWRDRDVLGIHNVGDGENLSTKLIVDEEIYDQNGSACGMYKIKQQYRCKQMES